MKNNEKRVSLLKQALLLYQVYLVMVYDDE
jgi:hypothetical protein